MLLLICMFSCCFVSCKKDEKDEKPEANIENAMLLIEKKDYEGAKELLEEMGDDQTAQELLTHFYYVPVKAEVKEENGDVATIEYFYDENNLRSQKVYTHSDGRKTTTDYTYDESGTLIKKVITYSYGDKTI